MQELTITGFMVDEPNLITYRNHTHAFEWYLVRCDSKNGYQKNMYSKEIELCAQNRTTILDSIVNIMGGRGAFMTI